MWRCRPGAAEDGRARIASAREVFSLDETAGCPFGMIGLFVWAPWVVFSWLEPLPGGVISQARRG